MGGHTTHATGLLTQLTMAMLDMEDSDHRDNDTGDRLVTMCGHADHGVARACASWV